MIVLLWWGCVILMLCPLYACDMMVLLCYYAIIVILLCYYGGDA